MRGFGAIVGFGFLIVPALAQAPVATQKIGIGVNPDGSMCDPTGALCLLYDPDGPEGPTPVGRDLIAPGRKFETWSAMWTANGQSRQVIAQAPDAAGPVSFDWEPNTLNRWFAGARGRLSMFSEVEVDLAIDVPWEDDIIVMTYTVTAIAAISGLQISRTVDLDPDFGRDRSYDSHNRADGAIAVSSSRYETGTSLALGVAGGQASVCSGWCNTVSLVLAGSAGPVTADRVIGAASAPVDLAAGETVRVRFIVGLGTSEEQAMARVASNLDLDDLDGDGVTEAEGDCNDRDPHVFPGAPALSDGKDNDCDGIEDVGPSDADFDEDGWTPAQGDCDDSDPRVYPGAPPVPGVLDADCDGVADQDPTRDGDPPEGWGLIVEGTRAACSSGPGSAWLAGAWLVLVFTRRRR